MDPFDHIRRAVADTRSGSTDVIARAALGFAGMRTRRDVVRGARALVRAHPAMGGLWRLAAAALDGDPAVTAPAFVDRLRDTSDAASDSIRWVATGRAQVVLTHSGSSAVARALARVRSRVARVICTASLPGGEGRAFARRLERDGFDVDVVSDAAIARACDDADIALVGIDAITPHGIVNKAGTRLVALAARESGIGCYAIGSSLKMVPALVWDPARAPLFDDTPLELFDAVCTERGPQRPSALRRAASRSTLPDELTRMIR